MPKTTVVFYQDDPDTVPVIRYLRKLWTNVGFESNGCVIWGMNFDARRPTFCEMGFMNYGFDSEPRIIECYISSMVGLQPYWRMDLKDNEVPAMRY